MNVTLIYPEGCAKTLGVFRTLQGMDSTKLSFHPTVLGWILTLRCILTAQAHHRSNLSPHEAFPEEWAPKRLMIMSKRADASAMFSSISE